MFKIIIGKNAALKIGALCLVMATANCSGQTYSTFFQPFDLVFNNNNGSKANSAVSVSLLAATPLTNTRVMLTFNKPVNLSSSQAVSNYRITDANGNQLNILAASRDPNNSNIIFLDTIPQTAGSAYTVTASNIIGVDGASLGSANTATFTAPTNADSTGPLFSSVSATTSSTVEIFFNEAVDKTSSELSANYEVRQNTCGGAATAVGSVVRDPGNFAKVTLTTGSALVPGNIYVICGSTAIRDIWGNGNGAQISSNTFTLIAPTPRVSSITSASPSTVLVTFSEDMDATGTAGTALTNRTIYTINQCSGGGSLTLPTNGTVVGTRSVLFTGVTTAGTVNQGSCYLTITLPGGTTCDTTAGLICSAAGSRLTTAGNTGVLSYNNSNTTDTSAPAVIGITTTNSTTVVVTFSEPVINVSTADFGFSPALNITNVSCSSNVCTLTTAEQSTTPYSLSITNNDGGIQDGATPANTLNSGSTTFTGDGRPYIVAYYPIDSSTILVEWSEPIGGAASVGPADYSINGVALSDPSFAGSTVALDGGDPSRYVKITLVPALTAGTSYTLGVINPTGSVDSTGNGTLGTIPNGGTFTGPSATVKPVLVSASSPSPTTILVTFNEPLNNATIAPADFTLTGLNCPIANPGAQTISSATQIQAGVVQLILAAGVATNGAACQVTITAANALTDLAGNGNTAGITLPGGSEYVYNGTGAADTTAPTVVSAIAVSSTVVRVYFSEPVTAASGQTLANYVFSPALGAGGVNPSSIVCGGTLCTLTLVAPDITSAVQYSLQISNVQDAVPNTMTPQTISFSGIGSSVTAPTLYQATLVNATTVELAFSEIMDLASAENAANYAVTGGNTVTAAVRQADATKVRLTFSPGAFSSSTSYTVTAATADTDGAGPITGIKDVSLVALGSPNSATFTGSATAPATTDLAAISDTGSSSTDNVTGLGIFPAPPGNGLQFTGTVAANTPVMLYYSPVVTFTDAGDLVTLNNHGLTNGSTVSFVSINTTTGIASNVTYYVISSTTNTFQVSLTPGGAAIPLTSNGTGILNVNIPLASTVSLSNGSYTVTVSSATNIVQGDNRFTVATVGPTGIVSDISPALTVTFDSSAPIAPTGLDLIAASDSGISSTDNITNSTSPQFTVGCETGATVILRDGTTNITNPASGVVCVAGSATLTAAITAGTYANINALQTDVAGNSSGAGANLSPSLVIDTTAPNLTAHPLTGNTSLALTFDENVYNVSGGALTTAAFTVNFAQNVGGTATSASITGISHTPPAGTLTLTLSIGGTVAGVETITVTSVANSVYDAAGNAASVTTGAKNLSAIGIASITGTPTYTATAPITGGTTGYISMTWSEGIYTDLAHTLPVTAADFTRAFVGNSGNSTDATIACVTNAAATDCSGLPGTAPAAGATAIRIHITNTGVSSGVETIQVNAGTNAIYSVTGGATPDTITTGVLTFPDRFPPGGPAGLALAAADDTGSSNSDRITSQTTALTISGTAEAASTVRLYQPNSAGTLLATTTADGSGNWTVDISLAAGATYTVVATARDAALNVSVDSAAISITIDNSADAAPGVPDLISASDTGSSNSDNLTSTSAATFTISCVSGSTVQLFDNLTATGVSGTCAAGTVTLTTATLSDGGHPINAKQTDAAGNLSAASASLTVTIDTAADAAPGTPDLTNASDTGTSNTDDLTNSTTPSFTVSCVTGSSVQLYDGVTATGTPVTCAASTATVTAATLASGTHATMNVRQTDAAGNLSPVSGNLSITIDNTADAAPGTPDMTSATDSGSSNSDDNTNNTTPSFTVSCVTGSSVQLFDNLTATGSAVTCAAGTATLTPAALSTGVHPINAKQTDSAGNLSPASTSLSVTIDTTADAAPGTPDLTNASDLGSSNSDDLTSTTTPSFTVSCVTGSSVQLFDGVTATGTPVTCAGATATLTAATLSAGTHASINAKQTDVAGNLSPASGNLSITIDTTADAAPGTPDLTNASDTGSSNSDNITNLTTPAFTVSCVTGSSVQLYDGVTATGTPVTCAASTATVTAAALSAGTHASMNAIQTDPAGNASPASGNLSITIDTTADSAPGVPDMTAATDSGISNSDDITSNTTPSFTVSCVTGSIVQLFDNITATGSAVTCAAGTATLTTAALSAGSHPINAKQTDAAGNLSAASASLTVTIDTAAASTGTPDMTAATDLGVSNTDNITSNATPQFTVSCENGASVQLYDGVSATGTAGTCAAGTVTLTAATLSSGAHNINAIQTDAAGNVSTASSNLAITIDTSVPAATGTPDMTAATDSGSSTTDNITNNATPQFTVSCENGASVQLYDGAVATGSAGTCAAGTVTLTAGTLGTGGHNINAVQTDVGGNASTASGNLSITIDTTAPAATGIPDLTAATDSGSSSSDNITNNTTPQFTVSCENGASVQLYDGVSATGSAVICASSTATLVAGTLSATTHANMRAVQTDPAGNVSATSGDLSITIDTSAPAVTGTPDLTAATDSGSSSTDNITNNTTPQFTVSCENGASVQLYDGVSATGSAVTCASGTATLTAGTLSSGTHASMNAIQTDAAGNVSGASSNLSITIDTTAPVISAVSPASSATISNTSVSYTLSETVASGSITWTRTGGTADSNHNQALTGAELSTGAHTGITITNNPTLVVGSIYTIDWNVTDVAGNAAVLVSSTSVTYANPTGPAITAAEYYDTDGNGRLDHVKLTFDKALSDSTMDGYSGAGTPANQLHSVTLVWSVAGYANVRMDTRDTIGTITGDNVTDDNVIWLAFDEIGSGSYDTNATPNLIATDSGLKGTAAVGGCYIQTSFANCSTQSFADIITTTIVETDKAAAIIVGATGITSSQYLTITFSEPVDNTNNGTCNGTLGYSDIKYNDVSASGISDIDAVAGNWNDVDACSDKIVRPRLAAGGTPSNLDAPSVNIDTVNPIANRVYDAVNNVSLTTPAEPVQYAIEPYVVSVSATAARKIRITFSEAVQTAPATLLTNYTLVESPVQAGCSGSGSDTVNLTGSVVQISSTIYELSTDADQCSTTTYSLTANATNIKDVNENLSLKTPNFGTFLGNERLKVASATCVSLSSFNVVFNKAVATGTAAGGSETVTRYKASGATSVGTLNTAVRGSSPNDNTVTLTHSVNQTGTSYTLIASNATNGDGFDDSALGVISTADLAENLQASPRDRAIFSGCGTAITDFSQGPISTNPFGDATDIGQIVSYDNKVYIGTNNKGNNVARFNPDGTSPTLAGFEFLKDTATVDLSSNTAATRDGGVAVPPYVTLGFSGCTVNNADLNSGCGPDNEDGRGTFTVGMIGSTNYLFLGGSRSAANFNYLHYTSDVDSTLNFKYIDMGTITGTATQGLESIIVFNDRVFPGMAKQNTGGGQNLPDFGKINFSTGSSQGDCVAGNNCEATDGTNGARFRIDRMPYFGGDSNDAGSENTGLNRAWIVGVDSLFIFNSKIYAANGGYHSVGGNGSIIRSNNSNPAVCTAEDVCPDWTEIGPRSDTKWHNSGTNNRFSLQLTKIANIIPNDKAFAQFAQFNGNLYVTRTACTIADGGGSGAQTSVPAADAGCNDGTDTNRVAQLWKCTPATTGSATDCDAGDWTVVGDNGTGITNFGSAGNKTMSMLVTNGTYLYVGFDNGNGIEIWRTNTANPGSSSAVWSQISTAGLGDITNLKQIFSAISIQDGTDYYIYIAAGKNGVPIAIYRQKNL